MHFCMGELDNIALFDLGESCTMEMQKPACHQSDGETVLQGKAKSCCEDQSFEVSAQEEIMQNGSISSNDFQLIAVAFVIVPHLFDQRIIQKTPFQDYSPPRIKRDIPVLIQSFLL